MQDHELCHNNVTPLHLEFMSIISFLYFNPKHFNIIIGEERDPWYPTLSLSANVILLIQILLILTEIQHS
jgi:hypothetical protein